MEFQGRLRNGIKGALRGEVKGTLTVKKGDVKGVESGEAKELRKVIKERLRGCIKRMLRIPWGKGGFRKDLVKEMLRNGVKISLRSGDMERLKEDAKGSLRVELRGGKGDVKWWRERMLRGGVKGRQQGVV